MKLAKICVIAILLFAIAFLEIPQNVDADTTIASDDWPMFRHDPAHTGYSTSVKLETKNKAWEYNIGRIDATSSPTVVDRKIYISSSYGNVYCLDANRGNLIWKYKTGGSADEFSPVSSPAVVNGKLYVGSEDTYVYCLDANKGSLIWRYKTEDIIFSSPAVVNGKVYVGSEDSHVYCLDANKGSLIWKYKTGDNVHSSPAVAIGKVYIGSGDGNVYCLDADKSILIWKYKTEDFVASSPAVANGKVYVGSGDGNVYCLDTDNGSLIWKYKTGDLVLSSPAVANGKVYVGSSYYDSFDGNVYCIDSNNGNLIWKYYTEDGVSSSAAVVNRKVYICPEDSEVLCLDADTGNLIWKKRFGEWFYNSPAVVNEKVYLSSDDGNVYCLESDTIVEPELDNEEYVDTPLENHPPTATRIEPASEVTIAVEDTIAFLVRAQDLDEDVDKNLHLIQWFIDDDQIERDPADGTREERSFTYTFENPGTFVVKANVYDEQMEEASVTWEVNVRGLGKKEFMPDNGLIKIDRDYIYWEFYWDEKPKIGQAYGAIDFEVRADSDLIKWNGEEIDTNLPDWTNGIEQPAGDCLDITEIKRLADAICVMIEGELCAIDPVEFLREHGIPLEEVEIAGKVSYCVGYNRNLNDIAIKCGCNFPFGCPPGTNLDLDDLLSCLVSDLGKGPHKINPKEVYYIKIPIDTLSEKRGTAVIEIELKDWCHKPIDSESFEMEIGGGELAYRVWGKYVDYSPSWVSEIQANRIPAITSETGLQEVTDLLVRDTKYSKTTANAVVVYANIHNARPEVEQLRLRLEKIISPDGSSWNPDSHCKTSTFELYPGESKIISFPLYYPSRFVWEAPYPKTGEWKYKFVLEKNTGILGDKGITFIWDWKSIYDPTLSDPIAIIVNEDGSYVIGPKEIGKICMIDFESENPSVYNVVVNLANFATNLLRGEDILPLDPNNLIESAQVGLLEQMANLELNTEETKDYRKIEIEWWREEQEKKIQTGDWVIVNPCFDRAVIILKFPNNAIIIDKGNADFEETDEEGNKGLIWLVNKVDKQINSEDHHIITVIIKEPHNEYQIEASLMLQLGPFHGDITPYQEITYLDKIDDIPQIYDYNKWNNDPDNVYWATLSCDAVSRILSGRNIELDKPVDLVLVLDESGSMSWPANGKSKMDMAKDTAIEIVDLASLYDMVRIGVVSFAANAWIETDLTSSPTPCKAKIAKINAPLCPKTSGGGTHGTCFGDGLEKALVLFENSQSNSRKVILFMSDGMHNEPPDPEPYVRECKNNGIVIYTVGFGPDADDKLLRMMADRTGGTYSFSETIVDFENDMIESFDESAGWDKKGDYSGSITEDETRKVGNFNVNQWTEYVKVLLNWPGSDLNLILVDPDGNPLNVADPSVVYSGNDSKPEYIIVNNPKRGTWTIKVHAKEVPEKSINYSVSVTELRNKSFSEYLFGIGMILIIFILVIIYIKRTRRN